VSLEATGDVLHHATVRIIQLDRSVETNNTGEFRFDGVPPGKYDLLAHMHALTDERKTVVVAAGQEASVDFKLKITTVREEVTVTASGREETTLEAFQAVTSLDAVTLATKGGASLGDVLEEETGVAKRSSGPGTSRPVVRGFDGDRVLVLQDGVRTGTLSSQSADHGEPVDAQSLERVEVVRGPATLLYGSNAIGGVVNEITGHHQHHLHPHEGWRGYLTGIGSSNNGRAAGSGGVEYGIKNWLIYADGGGQRSGNYHTPLGEVPNSGTELNNFLGGFGRYNEKTFVNLAYGVQDGEYQVPYDPKQQDPEIVSLPFRRQNVRLNSGLKNIGAFEQFQLSLSYTDWMHQEVANGDVHNEFFNKQFIYRGVFDQHKRGHLSGSLGLWGAHRDYKAVGEEALTPPVKQNSFAVFGLEQIEFEKIRFQLGARLENNRYNPTGLRDRNFTGFSGAAGVNLPLWHGGAFVANYTHSTRAPALEELYNQGPHAGNQTFEIGDATLSSEKADGIDVSVRHASTRLRAEVNFFHYALSNFIFLAPTGAVEDGLIVAEYRQGEARYQGSEARLGLSVHPNLWINLGVDGVSAKLTAVDRHLPRIPPVRGRIGIEARYKDFSLMPELVLADQQDRVYFNETRTAGYGVVNVKASYNVSQKHALHIFSLNVFNAGDKLYRNHLSFIKEFAPEIGRGVLFSYTVRFF
jgi:iron complex outermembrane receptor protein